MSAPLVLTTPVGQQPRWRAALGALGVDCVGLPLIDIAPLPLVTLTAAWQSVLAQPRLVMFVSPSAVAALDLAVGRPWPDWPPSVAAACVGPATAQALRERGVVDVIAPAADSERFESEALWPLLAARGPWAGAEVLILRGDGGRDWLAEQLTASGARVRALSVYQRQRPHPGGAWGQALAQVRRQPALWLLTSAQALDHGVGLGVFEPGAAVLATHPRIAQAARQAGLSVQLVRAEPEAVATAWRAWTSSPQHAG